MGLGRLWTEKVGGTGESSKSGESDKSGENDG